MEHTTEQAFQARGNFASARACIFKMKGNKALTKNEKQILRILLFTEMTTAQCAFVHDFECRANQACATIDILRGKWLRNSQLDTIIVKYNKMARRLNKYNGPKEWEACLHDLVKIEAEVALLNSSK